MAPLTKILANSLLLGALSWGFLGLLATRATGQEASDPNMEIDFGEAMGEDFNMDDYDFDSEPNPSRATAGSVALVFGVYGCALLVVLLITGIFAYLLSGVLQAVPEPFRELSPALPWLLYVPFVNVVILCLVFIKAPRSQSKYLASIGNASQGDCGEKIALFGLIGLLLCGLGWILLIVALLKMLAAKQVILASTANAQEAPSS